MGHTTNLQLESARDLISRAIDKAEQIKMRGAIAVVGGSGRLVSASRMDHGGAGGLARARSKAWVAATQQIPSAEHLGRLLMIPAPMVSGFSTCSPEAVFPGAGGMPIRASEHEPVIGGIAASGAGIGPFVGYPGADQQALIADGQPSNGEDLLVHYALGIPYVGQHGDDLERWTRTYGKLPTSQGTGMAEAPPAREQAEHRWALQLADRVIDLARGAGAQIAVAVVDSYGDPIQIDTMDGAVSSAPAIAETLAATAAVFGTSSEAVAATFPGTRLNYLSGAFQFAGLPVAGGVPITEDGVTVGGIGVAGIQPSACRDFAAGALGSQ